MNDAMRQSFDCLQRQLACPAPRKMFQCVPAHFCDVICQVGFNAECAPPDGTANALKKTDTLYIGTTTRRLVANLLQIMLLFLSSDPGYGEGIYFAGTVQKALQLWKLPNQEYVYIVEADVLTGTSTPGQCGLIVPPVLDTNPAKRYDSVSGSPDVCVIFNGRQALPTKIITWKMH